jgi:hypothetical protein
MSWKTEGPRNQGRIFSAWCGGQYVFALNSKGNLCTESYFDSTEFFLKFNRGIEDLMKTMDPYIDAEAGLAEVMRRARREEKARTFRARYAGSQDHRWRTQVPHENGTEDRMVIHDVPFQF